MQVTETGGVQTFSWVDHTLYRLGIAGARTQNFSEVKLGAGCLEEPVQRKECYLVGWYVTIEGKCRGIAPP